MNPPTQIHTTYIHKDSDEPNNHTTIYHFYHANFNVCAKNGEGINPKGSSK